MAKVLKLYNTFKRTLNPVKLNGILLSSEGPRSSTILGSLYICGPTVYSDCHLGHALTYIRADLFRRFMKSIFNVRLVTVMNITDIDDKILNKAYQSHALKEYSSDPEVHPYHNISSKYLRSFSDDLNLIRVKPADMTIKISNSIPLIVDFISKLEQSGYTYINDDKDVVFDVSKVKGYKGRIDPRKHIENISSHTSEDDKKGDPRDFVLWKSAKPNEPVWAYKSFISGENILGRPGWHVQCSAIASSVFGSKLDFHFGGKDLIFPHHYNEETCCCAFHGLDTSSGLHVWVDNWLHSGHLVMRSGDKEEKMSKSLGNVLAIKHFIDRSSVNALRLLCVLTHYRADINFSQDLMEKLKSVDHKISAFSSHLRDMLSNMSENPSKTSDGQVNDDLYQALEKTRNEILDGVCDDFNLEKGLNALLELSKIVYAKTDHLMPVDIVMVLTLLRDWCDTSGLEYGLQSSAIHDEKLLDLTRDFRHEVRNWAVEGMKLTDKASQAADTLDSNLTLDRLADLLKLCDEVRHELDQLGFVERDSKTGGKTK